MRQHLVVVGRTAGRFMRRICRNLMEVTCSGASCQTQPEVSEDQQRQSKIIQRQRPCLQPQTSLGTPNLHAKSRVITLKSL